MLLVSALAGEPGQRIQINVNRAHRVTNTVMTAALQASTDGTNAQRRGAAQSEFATAARETAAVSPVSLLLKGVVRVFQDDRMDLVIEALFNLLPKPKTDGYQASLSAAPGLNIRCCSESLSCVP